MGLLDALNSADGRFYAGLLAAAQPRAGGRMSLGGGLLEGLGQADAWTQAQAARAAAEQDRQMKATLMQAQIADMAAQEQQRRAQAAELQRKSAEQQRLQGLLQQAVAGGPITGTQANAATGIAGPRPEALGAVGQRPPINFQALIAQGVPTELVKALAESQDYGKAEVARTVDGMDPQGRPSTMQFDKFGNRVGAPVQQWKAPEKVDVGGQVQFVDQVTLAKLSALTKTVSPDAQLSANTTMRGQNMTDARARELNQINANAVGKVEWKQDVNGNWVGLPREVTGAGPVSPVTTTVPGKREQQAQNALSIIDAAGPLIDKSTNSYIGAGVDQAARLFGDATPGAMAGAQLKALEGALMMAQPRMEGPQSDKDVALYRQMAGQIGDTTVPREQKKAALQVIRQLHARYAGQGGNQGGGASGSWGPTVPATSGFKVLGVE